MYVDDINYICINIIGGSSNCYYYRFGDDMASNSCYNNTNRIRCYNYTKHI